MDDASAIWSDGAATFRQSWHRHTRTDLRESLSEEAYRDLLTGIDTPQINQSRSPANLPFDDIVNNEVYLCFAANDLLGWAQRIVAPFNSNWRHPKRSGIGCYKSPLGSPRQLLPPPRSRLALDRDRHRRHPPRPIRIPSNPGDHDTHRSSSPMKDSG